MQLKTSEADAQKMVFEWANWNKGKYHMLEVLYHIPNEGKRSKAAGAEMKRQGLKSGVSDICLPYASSGYSNLYIELKAGNNKVTTEQRNFVESINRLGGKAVIVYEGDNAIDVLKAYLDGTIDSLDIQENIYPAEKSKRINQNRYIGPCGIDCRECSNIDCLEKKIRFKKPIR